MNLPYKFAIFTYTFMRREEKRWKAFYGNVPKVEGPSLEIALLYPL